jgi:hypothetical protein
MSKVLVDKAVLQQALEALEYENSWHAHHKVKPYASTIDAITALKTALTQPEQEPLFVVEGGKLRPLRPALLNDGDKLYTHPPRNEANHE